MRVRVPATSANLGPGFDCLGLALELFLEVSVTPAPRDTFHYQGQGYVPDTPDNLVHQGFRSVYRALGQTPPTVHFMANNPIPLARGLGSSSAALVAGAALADGLLSHTIGRDGVFDLTARMEGHPDNVAPAVYGGFTVSAQRGGGDYLCQSLPVPQGWTFVLAVPDFELLTSESRAVLPQTYRREDAIFNLSRSALWTAAVALDRPELLPVAARDALHEPYREGLIPGFAACRRRLSEAGIAAFLSGAGPTLCAVSPDAATTARCQRIMHAFVGERGSILTLRASGGYEIGRGVPATASPPATP